MRMCRVFVTLGESSEASPRTDKACWSLPISGGYWIARSSRAMTLWERAMTPWDSCDLPTQGCHRPARPGDPVLRVLSSMARAKLETFAPRILDPSWPSAVRHQLEGTGHRSLRRAGLKPAPTNPSVLLKRWTSSAIFEVRIICCHSGASPLAFGQRSRTRNP